MLQGNGVRRGYRVVDVLEIAVGEDSVRGCSRCTLFVSQCFCFSILRMCRRFGLVSFLISLQCKVVFILFQCSALSRENAIAVVRRYAEEPWSLDLSSLVIPRTSVGYLQCAIRKPI